MSSTAASWTALLHGQRAVYTLLLTLGIGLHAVGLFIVGTVMPSVVADIGGAAFYTWSMMVYTVTSIMGTACGGAVRDRLGNRHGYIAGALIFLIGAVGCAVSPWMSVLLVARAIQGVGSGLLVALAYNLVGELYPESLRAHIFSAISGVWGLAALVGPLIGGVFAEWGWWRGAFWGVAPVVVGLIGLARYALPEGRRAQPVTRLPLYRLMLIGVGVLCIAASGQVVSLWLRLGLLVVACGFVGLSFYLDARMPNRLFPQQPLSLQSPVGTALWVFLCFGLATSQVTVYMPLIAQELFRVTPLAAGYFTAILSVGWTVFALASAGVQGRRIRWVVGIGPPLMTVGAIGMSLVVATGPLWVLGSFLALMGAGIGLCFAHISSWTIAAARAGEEALTASAIPMVQSLGIAFGAAIAGLVANVFGLASGDVSPVTLSVAVPWVYGASIVAPALGAILSWRFLQLQPASLG